MHLLVGIGTGLQVPMMQELAPGQPFDGGPRGIVDEFVSADSADSLDTALSLASTHGLLVGPSSGAAVRCALEIGRRPSMSGKTIVVLAVSSGVRYLLHPMFQQLRSEVDAALSGSPVPASQLPSLTAYSDGVRLAESTELVRPSRIPSLCTRSTRAGIEWCCCHRAVCMARPR